MLDFSWSHILIVLIVALVVVGPKDLPRLMRTIGQWTAKARGMANEFRRSFEEMSHQAEIDELRKELTAVKAEQASFENELNQHIDVGIAVDTPPQAAPQAAPLPAGETPEAEKAPSATPPALDS